MVIGEWRGHPAFACSRCGRVLYTNPEWAAYKGEIDNWLVAPWPPDPSIPYVRCPRHLTDWSLQQCNVSRTTKNRYWMIRAEWDDVVHLGLLTPIGQHLAPFPVRVEFVDDEAQST